MVWCAAASFSPLPAQTYSVCTRIYPCVLVLDVIQANSRRTDHSAHQYARHLSCAGAWLAACHVHYSYQEHSLHAKPNIMIGACIADRCHFTLVHCPTAKCFAHHIGFAIAKTSLNSQPRLKSEKIAMSMRNRPRNIPTPPPRTLHAAAEQVSQACISLHLPFWVEEQQHTASTRGECIAFCLPPPLSSFKTLSLCEPAGWASLEPWLPPPVLKPAVSWLCLYCVPLGWARCGRVP